MENYDITTYMSLKRQMKRKKDNKVKERYETGAGIHQKAMIIADDLKHHLPSFIG